MGNKNSSPPKPVDIGNAFKTLGHQIENSNNKIKNDLVNVGHTIEKGTLGVVHKIETGSKGAINTVKTEVQKPSFQQGLQKAVQITAGVVALTPIGKSLLKVAVLSGDAGSHGGASAYLGLGNTNSTLDMVPGGLLSQQIANVATNGKSGQQLNSTLPDPKRMAMGDAKTLGHTAINNPSQLGNTTHSLINNNKTMISSTSSFQNINKTIVKPVTTLHNPIQAVQVVKPTLFNAIPKPPVIIQNHTLKVDIPKTITTMNIKPSLGELTSKTNSTLNLMSRMPAIPRPSIIPKPSEVPKPIKSTLPIVNIAPVISEQQQVINNVIGPEVKPTVETIKPNVNAEKVDIVPALVSTSSTLPIMTSPPPTAIINYQAPQQGNIFEMILQFLSQIFK